MNEVTRGSITKNAWSYMAFYGIFREAIDYTESPRTPEAGS